ncbi:unnamed protein product [Spirodela intermedia]|uniref:Uncharacterized protein n=1 Tax=Spirodela intermedia TaxID=51605 RepID=A0A7I8KKK0_SPIIN|nr:unnamed protein product [Spirodela intermedia]
MILHVAIRFVSYIYINPFTSNTRFSGVYYKVLSEQRRRLLLNNPKSINSEVRGTQL